MLLKLHTESLIPKVTSFGDKVFKEVTKDHEVIRVGPNPIGVVSG